MRPFLHSAIVFTAMGFVLLGTAIVRPHTSVFANSKAKQRGAELYAERGCAHCHGPDLGGGKRGPDLQLVRKHMTKNQMRLQIHNGGMMMPAFGSTLTSPQIEDLIAYLRAKRKVTLTLPEARSDAINTVAIPTGSN